MNGAKNSEQVKDVAGAAGRKRHNQWIGLVG